MLLDTNAISALSKPDAGLLGVLRGDEPWYLPSIALGEFRFGLIGSNQRAAMEHWLNDMEAACSVLPADADTARQYAEIRDALIRANTPIPYHDIWIGALAIQHGLPVVSRDGHFDRISGLRRISLQPSISR
jgi:tRNA(fMet)-specific endonuclease VapC